MSSMKVSVKWNREVMRDLDVDTSEPVELFKTQLWTLTGVPPDRQTLMVKGSKLKDDASWDSVAVKPRTMIMMMGSAEELPEEPKEKIIFAEDIEEEDSDIGNYTLTKRGLKNFGNMCYVNATVQCLNLVDELKPILKPLRAESGENNLPIQLGTSLDVLMESLDPAVPNRSIVEPLSFFNILKTVNPEFGEQNEAGMYKQQDAEECWSLILTKLAQALKKNEGVSPIDALFGMTMEETCTNTERPEEVIVTNRADRVLRCHISGKTSHLFEGLQDGLEEEIERRSEALDRDAKWKQVSKIAKLPGYLAVHFVRFRWKAAENVKAKILKSISFPFVLDVLDLCADPLQDKLKLKRDYERKRRDAMLAGQASTAEASTAASAASVEPAAAAESAAPAAESAASAEAAMEVEKEKDTAASSAETAVAKPDENGAPMLLTAETGVYELIAVLTHQGRLAESGHYVSWCKDEKDGRWYQFDDDKVTERNEEDIRKLTGGGDWHMAYMLLYKARNSYDE